MEYNIPEPANELLAFAIVIGGALAPLVGIGVYLDGFSIISSIILGVSTIIGAILFGVWLSVIIIAVERYII
jgi:hypothetical protein